LVDGAVATSAPIFAVLNFAGESYFIFEKHPISKTSPHPACQNKCEIGRNFSGKNQ
jgi:hypothetical protein